MRSRSLFFAALFVLPIHLPHTRGPAVLKQLKDVSVPEVEGPVAHMAADVKGQRIFLAATGNNTIEIFDAQNLQRLNTISGLAQPQDLVYMPEKGQLLVSNGADGSLRTYDATTLKMISTKQMGGDADRVRLAPGGKSVLVGWGVGSLAILDLASGKRSDISLGSHPESFQLDSIGNHIFVNLPGLGQVSVIDRRSQTVIETWPLRQRDNISMALDDANRRVFVVCQKPARLLVLNMDDGSLMASLGTASDADDVFYDRERKRIYVVGGEGSVAVYKQKGADEYVPLARTDTVPEARTGLFVPDWKRLYVVAKSRDPGFPAEMMSFEVLDDAQPPQ